MNETLLITAAERLLTAIELYFANEEDVKLFKSRDLASCVLNHAAAAGVAAMAGGVLPAAGSVVAVTIVAGAIWRMYIKICKIIGVHFGKNKLKAISSAVLTNIITQLAGVFAIQLATSFIPGAAVIILGIGNFAITYFAGLIFLNVLTELFGSRRQDIDDLNTEDWKESIKSAMSHIDKKAVFKESKEIFNELRKNGSLESMGKNVDISAEEDTLD